MDEVEIVGDLRAELGEGPLWLPDEGRLAVVDIDGGALHLIDPAAGRSQTIVVGAPVGFAVPVSDRDEFVVAEGNDLVRIDRVGHELGRLTAETDRPGNRINDGKADPAGRLWFGTMSPSRAAGTAALYRLDRTGLTTVDATVGLSNGLDWDLERGLMYYIDSATQRIDVFDYDDHTGEVEHRRPFVAIAPDDGLPDGLTLDSSGHVWVALFRGGVVRSYTPDGELDTELTMPVAWTTCPAFGGENYETLFVTTSRHRLTAEQRPQQPLAGAVFAARPGAIGHPAHRVDPEVAERIGRAAG